MENTNKKSKAWKWVLTSFAIAAITAGVGVGIGYAIWHNRNNTPPLTDVISFGDYRASMTSAGSQVISARSSEGKPVTLSAVGSEEGTAWQFENDILTYLAVTTETTVTITANDGIAINSIRIDLLPQGEIPETFYEAHWDTTSNGALQSGTCNVATLWFGEYGSNIHITDGVTYAWKDSSTVDSRLSLSTDGVVRLADGLTANTSAEINCMLNEDVKDVIQVLAFAPGAQIPAYNTVSVSGYIQSKNASSRVIVTVKGYHYTMTAGNNRELSVVNASSNNQSNKVEITDATLDGAANTIAYIIEIKPLDYNIDIAGNFALSLTPSDANISPWSSGDIAIFPEIQTSFNVSCANPNLTIGTTDTLLLTWTATNFTPTSVFLKTDGSSNTKWILNGGNPLTPTLTLARQNPNLPVGVYNVVLVASNSQTQKEATVAITISIPIPDANQYIAIKINGGVITGDIAATLDFSNQQLASLYIPQNSILQILNCNYNSLPSLDVSNNTALEKINCSSNLITSIDISNDTNLKELNCGYNTNLELLDVSTNINLEVLRCGNDKLSSIGVSNNAKLTELECPNNSLTEVDVSKNTALEKINCNSNSITSIDISKNTALKKIECSSNLLASLDVSSNENIESDGVKCYSNVNLVSIKLPHKPAGSTSVMFFWTSLVFGDMPSNGSIEKSTTDTINGPENSGWTVTDYQ